jgi:cytochrome c oxidase subunit II
MNTEFQIFPDAASTAAGQVDALYLFMVVLSVVLSVFVAGLVIYLAIRYRRANNVNRDYVDHGNTIEYIAMAISFPILMGIFLWGAKVCFFLFRAPEQAMPITVVAKQWMWKFQHADGRREIDTLHIPTGQPVKLTMVSQDVIHSFFVPAFRTKQDVLPGRYTSVWFEATEPGEYRLYCAEYCGTNHSRMIGKVIVQSPDDFARWMSGDAASDEPPAETGRKLFEQYQCGTCHRPANEEGARGPTLENLFQSRVPLAGGQTVVADETYIRESILRPAQKQVAGYQQIMPTYEGQISEEGVMHLIAYIKTLGAPKRAETPASQGGEGGDLTAPTDSSTEPAATEPAAAEPAAPPAEDNAANDSEGTTP